jgi:diguanylate cyclase (GGDEF)-like protein
MQNLDLHLDRPANTGPDSAVVGELYKYVDIVHNKFPVYEELLVLTTTGELIVSTSKNAFADVKPVLDAVSEGNDSARLSAAHMSEDGKRIYQWLFVPIGETENGDTSVLMIAKINLDKIGEILNEIRRGQGGDLYLMDARGRYLTQPRHAKKSLLGSVAMQVPTRDTGVIRVDRRTSYDDRSVFYSISGIEENGWWLAYEEDYKSAMMPVTKIRTRIWVAVVLIGVVFILFALKIVQSMMRPVYALQRGAQRINEGLVGVNIPKGSNDEIGLMIDTFNEMAKTITLSKAELQYKNKKLNSQNDQLQDMNRKLEELSITDGLTGLFNHRHFWNILNTELTRVNLYQGDLALLLIDLDDFKRVNDQFGHTVGDLLLQSVARIMKETVRETDIVARYGGEEFTILLPDTDQKGVKNVTEKIRSRVEALRFKVPETDITISVTVSVGVSVFQGNRREFFNAADRALYLSKSEGKNRVKFALQA